MRTFRSRFAGTILAALAIVSGPAAWAANDACQYLQVAKLPLHYRGPGLEITVDGLINDTPAPMLVDTGAFTTLMTRTGTEKRDLKLDATSREAEGVGGVSALYTAWVDQFSIGPSRAKPSWVAVIGLTGDTPAYDAIVGAPFLLQMDMELALADKEIKFFKPQGCGDRDFLAYWDRNAIVIPAKRGYDTPNLHFKVHVNGRELDAIIDSGAGISSIVARAARRIGVSLARPDLKRLQYSAGIGESLAPTWSARTASIKIGNETILDADIGIVDVDGYTPYDMILGADFLRAHRVLFAMSQDRLYISYTGGDVFQQRASIEPWVRREAAGGNPDAQMELANRYFNGKGVAKDEAEGQAWLDKAVALGDAHANTIDGYRQLERKRYPEAAARLAVALANEPDGRYHALTLYLARLRSNQRELGAQELSTRFARYTDEAWPGPIARFYLGRIDIETARAQARLEPKFARQRGCEVDEYLADLYRAEGKDAAAEPVQQAWDKRCAAKTP